MKFTIRRAEAGDVAALAGFNAAMALETECKVLDLAVLTPGVENLLKHPDYGFYLVAENAAGEAVGCLMITYEWSDWRNGLLWWVQSVYVAKAYRGRGVYRSLYARVKELAREGGSVRGFRLYVERENEAAQATYRRLGMKETPYRMFEEML